MRWWIFPHCAVCNYCCSHCVKFSGLLEGVIILDLPQSSRWGRLTGNRKRFTSNKGEDEIWRCDWCSFQIKLSFYQCQYHEVPTEWRKWALQWALHVGLKIWTAMSWFANILLCDRDISRPCKQALKSVTNAPRSANIFFCWSRRLKHGVNRW